MLSELTHEHFAGCVGEKFRTTLQTSLYRGEDGQEISLEPQDLELVEVKVLGDPIPGVTQRQGFSLLFHGPPDALLPQAIYRFEQAKLGILEFMLVPLGPSEQVLRYEAVFS